MLRKIGILLLIAVMITGTATAAFGADGTAEKSFSDVTSGKWFYTDVMSLVYSGGIQGYPDGTFKPNATITAAEFTKITVAMLGDTAAIEETAGGKWYTPYADAALKLEIVPQGMFETTDWNKPISRQKMAVIMELTAEKVYNEATITDTEKLTFLKASFKDYESCCTYCKDYIIQAVGRGLIQGYTDKTFKPENNATRAEASTMLVRLFNEAHRMQVSYTDTTKTKVEMADYCKLYDPSNGTYFITDPSEYAFSFVNSDDESTVFYHKDMGACYAIDADGNDYQSAFTSASGQIVMDVVMIPVNKIKYFVISNRSEEIRYIFENPLI